MMIVNSQERKVWAKIGTLLALASALLYVFSRFLPLAAPGRYLSADDSWVQVLHVAFEQHLQFGRDICFSFGPWGFLFKGYYPPTFALCATMWTILSLVFWWAGWRVACYFSGNKFFSWLWLMGFIAATGIPVQYSFDVRSVALVLLLLFLHFFVEDRPVTVIQISLAVALGLLSLVKFTSLVEAVIVVVVIAADNVFRQRRFPWAALAFAASVLFFWLAAGQRLDLFPSFLHNSSQITDGYTEAMRWDDVGQTLNVEFFLLSAGLLGVLTGYAAWKRHGYFGIFPVAGLGAILFLTFKHGFVRFDDIHKTATMLTLLVTALACLAAVWPVIKKESRWLRLVSLLLVIGILFIVSFTFSSFTFADWLRSPRNELLARLAGTFRAESLLAPARLFYDTGYLRKAYAENLGEVRDTFPLPPIQGSVDVYPWNQAVLFAHGLQYDPRPVIQSYSAYTPELAELNAAHLRSTRAANNVLFDIDPTDMHFPSLEDGLSWPELLTRYDIQNMTNSTLLLKQSAMPRSFQLTPLAELPVHFNEPVTLPATGNTPLWAELEINKSLLGAVVSTLYKPPVLLLKVSLRGGPRFYYHLIPGMARSGFLLSPLIQDTKSFVALASASGWSTNLDVISMTISVGTQSRSTSLYQSPMRLRLYRLDFPRQNLNQVTAAR
jgi:hypothetical protein